MEVETGDCPQNLELRWMSEVQSSVYATPLITDLFSDGQKDIVVPSFVHHLEVNLSRQCMTGPTLHPPLTSPPPPSPSRVCSRTHSVSHHTLYFSLLWFYPKEH